MGKLEPEVLDGLRGPRSERIDKMRESAERSAEPTRDVPTREGVTTYVSKYPGYRVQIAVADDVKDPYTGRSQKGKIVSAQFKDGIFVNSHKDAEIRRLTDQVLQELPEYGALDGKGRIPPHSHFWLASTANEARKAAQLEAAKRTLASLPPEQIAAFMDELGHGTAMDHSLPKREKQIET